MTVSPENAPNKAREVEIEYYQGDPVAVDGKRMSPAILMTYLNKLGGQHGIGRVDLVENRYVGMKSRGCLRDAGWNYPTRGSPRTRIHYHGSGSTAPSRQSDTALCRTHILWVLV